MSSKISKTLLLCSVLGSLLFASAVPTADAFLKPPAPKASHLEGGKQGSWFSKHWRAAVFAVGLGIVGVYGFQSYQPINETEVAQSLVATGTLSNLYGKLLSGEEEERLVYYIHDGETKAGWLDSKTRHIEPYIPDKDSIYVKISHLANHLPFLSNKDLVSNEAIMGKLLPTGYQLYATTFSNEDGQVLSGATFATLLPLEAKEKAHPPTYVILVTHHDKQELEAEDRYFTTIPDNLIDEYGVPPLMSFSNASALDLIDRLRQQAFGYELTEQQRMAIDDIRQLGIILETHPPDSEQVQMVVEEIYQIGNALGASLKNK